MMKSQKKRKRALKSLTLRLCCVASEDVEALRMFCLLIFNIRAVSQCPCQNLLRR